MLALHFLLFYLTSILLLPFALISPRVRAHIERRAEAMTARVDARK